MTKSIYRGHNITQEGSTRWVVSKDDKVVHVAVSEDAAMNWVDADRRKQAVA